MIRFVFLSTLFLQITASLIHTFQYGTSIGSYLFLELGWKEMNSLLLERGFVLITFASFFLAQWKRSFYVLISFFFLSLSFTKFLLGGFFLSHLIIPAHLARILFPLYGYFKAQKNQENWIIIGLASTFIFHGVEALYGNPEFLDLFMYFYSLIFGDFVMEGLSSKILLIVGIVDIFAGVGIFFARRNVALLVYFLFWGLFTAALRPIFYGLDGIIPFFERIPHFVIPLLLILHLKYYKRENF